MRALTRSAFVLVVLAAACAQPAPPPPSGPDLAAAEQAIRDADARWLKAAQAKDAAADAAALASDGVAYREHSEPMVGPAAFQAYIEKEHAENPKADINWTTDRIQVVASGDFAIQTGSYHVKGLGPKGDIEDKGRFVTVWKKVGADWKVAHDIGVTTMPEPPVKH
jgi:ketosteroid isomerase-like protein